MLHAVEVWRIGLSRCPASLLPCCVLGQFRFPGMGTAVHRCGHRDGAVGLELSCRLPIAFGRGSHSIGGPAWTRPAVDRGLHTAWLYVICDRRRVAAAWTLAATCDRMTLASSCPTSSVSIGAGWRIWPVRCRRFRRRRNESIAPDRKRTFQYDLRTPRCMECRTGRCGPPARLGTAKYKPVGSKDAR